MVRENLAKMNSYPISTMTLMLEYLIAISMNVLNDENCNVNF